MFPNSLRKLAASQHGIHWSGKERALLPTLPPSPCALLRSQAGPHAGAWFAATPSSCKSAWPISRMCRDDSRGKLLGERAVVTGAGDFAAAQACAHAPKPDHHYSRRVRSTHCNTQWYFLFTNAAHSPLMPGPTCLVYQDLARNMAWAGPRGEADIDQASMCYTGLNILTLVTCSGPPRCCKPGRLDLTSRRYLATTTGNGTAKSEQPEATTTPVRISKN